MKYCSKCGAELFDEAVICVKCGCPVESSVQFAPEADTRVKESGITTAVKVFLILSTVLTAMLTFCISLAWCLPMTISYCDKVNRGDRISTGFKVCALLFVNTIAGILMLCDNKH